MAAKPTRDLVLGFIQDQEMESTASYVARGRAYAGLSDDEATTQWADAFRRWTATLEAEPMNDLAAELSLRDIDLPMHLVEAEWAQVRDKALAVLREEDAGGDLEDRLAAYTRRKDASTN
jgi:regulator of sirC expression with transglutaminase-like and TPR domain